MLTGVMPFGAASYLNAKQFSNLEMPPTPLVSNQQPDAPKQLDAVIDKALSRVSTDRQKSVEELFREYEEAISK